MEISGEGDQLFAENTIGRVTKLGQGTILHSTLGNINLRISLNTKIYVWVTDDDDQSTGELLGYERKRSTWTLHTTREELMYSDQFLHEIVKAELMGWAVSENSRNKIITHVLQKSRKHVESVPLATSDVLYLRGEYYTEMHQILTRSYVIDEMNRNYRMVPAADSSIESLKSKIISDGTNCESCTICLDEFCAGCEALCMPCSHAFHGDCIKEWLKTSHYCPLCRYEMPTN